MAAFIKSCRPDRMAQGDTKEIFEIIGSGTDFTDPSEVIFMIDNDAGGKYWDQDIYTPGFEGSPLPAEVKTSVKIVCAVHVSDRATPSEHASDVSPEKYRRYIVVRSGTGGLQIFSPDPLLFIEKS